MSRSAVKKRDPIVGNLEKMGLVSRKVTTVEKRCAICKTTGTVTLVDCNFEGAFAAYGGNRWVQLPPGWWQHESPFNLAAEDPELHLQNLHVRCPGCFE
jgi:hypothetical protein